MTDIQCIVKVGGKGGGGGGGRGQWLGCTTPPRLAGCDHTFIAVPQATHSLLTCPGVVYAHGGSAD